VKLTGQGDFHGTWTNSLVDPHIAGAAKATQLAIELPAAPATKPLSPQLIGDNAACPVRYDRSAGSYAAERIAISHSELRRGKSDIASTAHSTQFPRASLNSTPTPRSTHTCAPAKSASTICSRSPARACHHWNTRYTASDRRPIHALGGSAGQNSTELPCTASQSRISAPSTMANQLLNLASVTASAPPGNLSASGSYDLKSRHFQVDAKGSAIDVAKIETLHRQDPGALGKLGFTVTDRARSTTRALRRTPHSAA